MCWHGRHSCADVLRSGVRTVGIIYYFPASQKHSFVLPMTEACLRLRDDRTNCFVTPTSSLGILERLLPKLCKCFFAQEMVNLEAQELLNQAALLSGRKTVDGPEPT